MSKNMKIKTTIKDSDVLRDALLTVCTAKNITCKTGYDLTCDRYSGRATGCLFVIPKDELHKAGHANSFGDIGFRFSADDGTYEILLDDYDSRDQELVNAIKREYAILQVTRKAQAQGMQVEFLDTERRTMRLTPQPSRRQVSYRRY